ncbi:MAG TPA: 23S rRNA (guanosine(2251)-2'-O)-methyltransferase RlmB [Caulobacteraceae bacterium]
MSANRERNDRRAGWDPSRQGGGRPPKRRHGKPSGGDAKDWVWGVHAVEAALANPARGEAKRLLATPDRARKFEGREGLEIVDVNAIVRALPQGAVHQGLAAKIDPPPALSIDEIGEAPKGVLVMLDQITDPQNVGAIFRSAAAFGARGVILQDRHAPILSGALAKAAAGAIDKVPHAAAVNLSRALERLADLGWRTVGLDGAAETTLDAALDGRPTVLVLGSEGEGLRRLVSEHCDALARIPMPGGFESLNVSNAAAVALYEASRTIGA